MKREVGGGGPTDRRFFCRLSESVLLAHGLLGSAVVVSFVCLTQSACSGGESNRLMIMKSFAWSPAILSQREESVIDPGSPSSTITIAFLASGSFNS
jgi:hypothetical protein